MSDKDDLLRKGLIQGCVVPPVILAVTNAWSMAIVLLLSEISRLDLDALGRLARNDL